MPVTAPVEILFDRIARSGLLAPELLDPYRPRDGHLEPPARITARLVQDGLLTHFQARQIARGKFRGFFLTEKYKVLDHIGDGGMGKVFLCEHLLLHRLVAVKILNTGSGEAPPPGAVERFYREARAVAVLDHPNIVRVFDVDQTGGVPFMVIEYVDGTDLHKLVTNRGALSPARAAEYVRLAAIGLQQAHEAGLVHRDVKPSNLLLDRTGNVKLLDLGLARFRLDTRRNARITERFDANAVLGTLDYMAPEQAVDSSSVDIRADIYSLGCTLYYLLTGKLVFADVPLAEKLQAHQLQEPVPIGELRPDVPPALAAVARRMHSKKPADRFATPLEVARALAEWAEPAGTPPPDDFFPPTRAASYRLGLALSTPDGSSVVASATPHPGDLSTPSRHRTAPPPDPSESVVLVGREDLRAGDGPNTPAWGEKPDSDSGFELNRATPRPAPAARPLWARRRVLARGAVRAVLAAAVGVGIATRRRAPSADVPNPPPPAAAPTIAASGSSFVEPMMRTWAGEYEKRTGRKVDYQAVGSGKGVEDVLAGRTAFGCTEAPLTHEQLAELARAGKEFQHVPLVMGAVVPVYNIPGVSEQLRFEGVVLADIYLGTIAVWDHPSLVASNPTANLPKLPIVVVRRGDPSGTTAIWTDYLSKRSAAWRTRVGGETMVKWPVGVDARGNEGVAGAVNETAGAIGYVELTYALANNRPFGVVRNRTGRFVPPSFDSVTAAAAAALQDQDVGADLRYSVSDPPGEDVYPISGTCWAVLPVKPDKPDPEAVRFLEWATHEGQALAAPQRYAPIPEVVRDRLDAVLFRLSRR